MYTCAASDGASGFNYSFAVLISARGTYAVSTFAAVPRFSFLSTALIAARHINAATTFAAVPCFSFSYTVPLTVYDASTCILATVAVASTVSVSFAVLIAARGT